MCCGYWDGIIVIGAGTSVRGEGVTDCDGWLNVREHNLQCPPPAVCGGRVCWLWPVDMGKQQLCREAWISIIVLGRSCRDVGEKTDQVPRFNCSAYNMLLRGFYSSNCQSHSTFTATRYCPTAPLAIHNLIIILTPLRVSTSHSGAVYRSYAVAVLSSNIGIVRCRTRPTEQVR